MNPIISQDSESIIKPTIVSLEADEPSLADHVVVKAYTDSGSVNVGYYTKERAKKALGSYFTFLRSVDNDKVPFVMPKE